MVKHNYKLLAYDEFTGCLDPVFFEERLEVSQEDLPALKAQLQNFIRRWKHRRERDTFGGVPK